MVLFLHNRYRTTGGEERAVEDLLWLVREQLSEPAELLTRASASLGRAQAAVGLLRGGLDPGEVAEAVRRSGARVVHAHNLQPALGWRALAAARSSGAAVVLHLHQYRLVCAIGVCYTRGSDCTRCRGRATLPGVRLRCRGSMPEALAYAASLSLWQRRLVEQADALIVPSSFALERLRALGAPLPWGRVRVLPPPLRSAAGAADGERADSEAGERQDGEAGERQDGEAGERRGVREVQARDGADGAYALVVSRLAPEKGIDVAIEACRLAGLPLLIAGEGPESGALRERARGAEVRFLGRVDDARLAGLRAGAAIALVPSRSAESFGLAAAEAMAAGVPVAGSRVGALPDLLEEAALAPAGDAAALAQAMARLLADPHAGRRGRERVRALCDPHTVAEGLAEVYDAACART